MMGIETIREINRQATKRARTQKREPFVPTKEQRAVLATGDLHSVGFAFPFLADYMPKGWEMTDDEQMFVDMSGFGAPDEPALTQEQFAKAIAGDPEGTGYAMTEHGQFQCYVARYRRKATR